MRLKGLKCVYVVMIGIALLLTSPLSVQGQTGSNFQLDLRAVGSGFSAPLYVTHAGDGSGRLFVVEKAGRIMILRDGKKVDKPFLDIISLVNSAASERGLLGLAFHPKYKENGLFFVYYTAPNGDLTIARYKVSADPDTADPGSAKIILTIEHRRFSNHNGGMAAFGPDGYLYLGIGDGGSGGDPQGNGQNPMALLAKLLRIDVDSGDPYGIPKDNPFADGKAGKPEVWAIGLRNPWRFSFDRATGDLYIADVGQNAYEEVNFQKAGTPGGVNYGWNTMEGSHCYSPQSNCNQQGLVLPVAEYSHSQGISITGGYVYRGKLSPRLQGYYFYGDYGTGRIWALRADSAGAWKATEVLLSGMSISSFGEDEAGEVYLIDIAKGNIYQLVDKG